MKPLKKTLSHSQVETFGQCPKRWSLQKIERVPQAPSGHLVLGDAVHQALQADGEKLMAGSPPLPMPLLTQAYRTAFNERMTKDDPNGLLVGEIPDLYQRGLAMLAAYVEHVQPRYRPGAVERAIEPAISIPGTDWTFTGRFDALIQQLTTMTIVDFKTASKPWRPGDEHTKDQATAYTWAAEQMDQRDGWEIGSVRVMFVVLCSNTASFRPTERNAGQIAAYMAGVRATAEAIERAVETKTYPARTGPLCGWCGVLGACSAGQAWLKERGRTPAVPVLPSASAK
jgi:hypothetical protein